VFDVSVQVNRTDLSEEYLTQLTQLGVDRLDFTVGSSFPGVEEQGYPDLDGLLELKEQVRSYGLRVNRVTLPDIGEGFMSGESDDRTPVENSVRALEAFAEAGFPIARQRFAGSTFPALTERYDAVHRGGMVNRGERLSLDAREAGDGRMSPDELDAWWDRFFSVYDELVPVADRTGIKLAMHPSDTPNHHVPFDGIGLNRIIDRYPSPQVGLVYCVGTRAEAGGSSLVLDEINHFGRKDRIFLVHMRNVRGSLATAGGFEETLLDDGDLNVYQIFEALESVGFSGCVNPDHLPEITGDTDHGMVSGGYSVGYLKAMGAALEQSRDPRV
jgi:mannonate dehydratase